MGLLKHLLLGFLFIGILTLTCAAPAEPAAEDKPSTAVAVKSDEPAKKVDERAVVVSDQTWDVWFNQNAWSIALGTLGVLLIGGGLAVGSYFAVYKYNLYQAEHYPNTPYQFSQSAYPQYTAQYYTPANAR